MKRIILSATILTLGACEKIPMKADAPEAPTAENQTAASRAVENKVIIIKGKSFEGPRQVTVSPSEVMVVNLNTEVEMVNEFVTAPDMTVAMAEALSRVAERVSGGAVALPPDVQWAQFRFTVRSPDGQKSWDLVNMRVPIDRLRVLPAGKKATRFLELVDMVEEGGSPEGLTSVRNYCDDHAGDNPQFCALVAAALLK